MLIRPAGAVGRAGRLAQPHRSACLACLPGLAAARGSGDDDPTARGPDPPAGLLMGYSLPDDNDARLSRVRHETLQHITHCFIVHCLKRGGPARISR